MGIFNKQRDDDDFVIDLDQVPDDVTIPDGLHAVRLTGWRKGRSKNGKPRLRFSWKILEGEGAGGVVCTDFYWTDNAAGLSKKRCLQLGINPERSVDDYPPIYARVEVQNTDYTDKNGEKKTYPVAEFVGLPEGEPPASGGEGSAGGGGGVPGLL